MPVPRKTPAKSAGAKFVTSGQGGKTVKVARDGGVNIGTPRGCESKRAHRNLKTGY